MSSVGTLTSYLEVARPFCKSSQTQLTGRSYNVNAWNNYFYLKRNPFIPDAAEVSEVKEEEEILFDQEAAEEEESRKKDLALKVKEMMRLRLFYLRVYFSLNALLCKGIKYIQFKL